MILWPLTSLPSIPRTPFVPHLQTFGRTIMHYVPPLRFQTLRDLSYPFLPALPPLSFLLSNVIILFFPHPLRYQSHPDSVNSVIKNPSLDLAVHGINPSIKSHQKSQLKGLQSINPNCPSNSYMSHILCCHAPKKSFSKIL